MHFILGLIQSPVVIGLMFTAVIGPLVSAGMDWLHVNKTSSLRKDAVDTIHNALMFGIAEVAKGRSASPLDILKDDSLMNEVKALATDYLNENASALLAKLKLSDTGIANVLSSKLLSSLNDYSFHNGQIVKAASPPAPATPPVAGLIPPAL